MISFSSYRHQRGFTYTELLAASLIVIATIAIVYPVFAQIQQGDQKTEIANAKEIAVACLMYTQDYDENYPLAGVYVKTAPGQKSLQCWGSERTLPNGTRIHGLIDPYIKHRDVFLNPENTSDSSERILEFMYNDLLSGQSMPRLANPARTVLVTSAENRLENAGHAYTPNSGPFPATGFNKKGSCDAGKGASIREARVRNKGGAVFAFADGHVHWFRGGADDPIFFPSRASASITAVDPKTKAVMGPSLGTDMRYKGRTYKGTFHIQ